MMDSVPIVCITGQVSSKVLGTDAFQEIDITGITLPITKHNFLVTRAEDIAPTIREAFQIAMTGRPGPVLVDITKDAQQATALFDFDAAAPAPHRPHPMLRAESDSIREAVALISAAKKPVILAGHGIIVSGARDQVIAFAESRNIPVASTLLGLGAFPTDHPLALGMMGMHGESWVNEAIQESDLLLAFGMRFDDRVTGNLAQYAPHAKKIHIEIDPAEISKNVHADVALIGDLAQILDTLLPLLPKKSDASWIKQINALKGDASVRDIINLPDLGHLYAAHVIHDIWCEARDSGRLEQTVIVTDVGQHQMWEAQYYRHDHLRTLITSGGLGTMGFALPAAIGAKFACPEKDVWVIAGDGGFQMTASELATIQQEGIAINIAVINNGFLGMVRQWQEIFYEKNYQCTPILSPDFVLLAAAHGIAGATVRERKAVIPTVTQARTSGKPFLINFQVEKEDGVYPMIAPGAALHEMTRRPTKDPLLETPEDV
jgi:acetolactate synthase-1/2/3 large subunit